MQGLEGGFTSYLFSNSVVVPSLGCFIAKGLDSIDNSIVFSENCKTGLTKNDNIPLFDREEYFHLELRLETGGIFCDRWLLLTVDSAKSQFDNSDAEKIENPGINLFSLTKEQKKLSIDARPLSRESSVIVGVATDQPRKFSLRFVKNSLPKSFDLLLHDKFLHKWIPMIKDSSYEFSTSADTMSFGKNRFEICRKKTAEDSMGVQNRLIVSIFPQPVRNSVGVKFQSVEKGNTTVVLMDFWGRIIRKYSFGILQSKTIGISMEDLPSGLYSLKLICGTEERTEKIMKL
jgi:hypothetical protein